ncbi:AbgT family transporter [Clostridium sp.]|uniref:AbgT family transporter n=1 Tax=Clostridium sp. TaxID=1506 RepID=UPI0026186F73|nr:AbgT family transporter [Clostridium sp.]
MKVNSEIKQKKGGILSFIETVGNKLPHPATIFVILCAGVMILSHILAAKGVSVTYEGIDKATNEIKDITISVQSLLTPEGIRYIFESLITNFTSFAALGTVLVAMLGVGVAEGTGLIGTSLRRLVLKTPKSLVTLVVVFAGVMSSIASDAGYVVLIPLGAVIFMSCGRHPIAGIAAAFAGVSGGFSANLFPGPVDSLLGGMTAEGARMIDSTYSVSPVGNWYFIIASTFVITLIGTLVTEKIVEPRLGKYSGGLVKGDEDALKPLDKTEKSGLKFAGIFALIGIIFICMLVLPENGVLRNPETGAILKSPFMNSIVVSISLVFLLAGVGYGIGVGKIKSDKDVIDEMSKTMSTMGGYIVLVFFAAQFVAFFGKSNLGTVIAVKGADMLEVSGIQGIPLLIGFIIVTAFINLFMGSASAKWAIMAPIFVPMLMGVHISPEMTQMAYRIGDSTTNIISPLMTYFALIVSFTEKYDKESGIGTMISTMLPYSVCLLIGWTVLLMIWYVFKLPLGPGTAIVI